MDFGKIIVFILILSVTGCSRGHYRRSADREVGKIISQKSSRVPNMETAFTIEQTHELSLAGFPENHEPSDFYGENSNMEIGAKILSLTNSLEIAVRHSPNYQSRKELLYLEALSLTLARHRYTPIFSAGGDARYHRSASEVREGVDSVVEEDRSITLFGGAGVQMLMRTGGRLAADFTTDFLRYLAGDPRTVTSSSLAARLSQPLLRGAGHLAATENLTQAERNLLYTMRNFVRFRKEFSVQIASRYYEVLQNRDTVKNTWRGYQNFKRHVAREQALADEGKRTLASLRQLKQAELSTESRWINAIRNYSQSLDEFKILLGLSTDAKIILEDSELEHLQIIHPELSVEDALRVALESRLDLYNVREQYEDTSRKVRVAANSLKPDLNLVGNAVLTSREGNRFHDQDLERVRWSAGLDADLPLDRKAERNGYRAALISERRAERELQLAVDTVKLDVYEGWRNLDQAKRNYEISNLGVELSERRVEEQVLRAELGRGLASDLVDAQNDLINSQNEKTRALVNHTIARLQFWNDLGLLHIDENGGWKDVTHVENE